MKPVHLTILGQPQSKANSRKLVKLGGRMASIKSDEARAYERDALRQIPVTARLRLEGPVAVWMRIWYRTELPDLDESLVLDCLQDRFDSITIPGRKEKRRVLVQAGVYRNDRSVREKHVHWGIDKINPRAEIIVQPMAPQQTDLAILFAEAADGGF